MQIRSKIVALGVIGALALLIGGAVFSRLSPAFLDEL